MNRNEKEQHQPRYHFPIRIRYGGPSHEHCDDCDVDRYAEDVSHYCYI